MVVAVTPYTDAQNKALAGQGFDGIVRVIAGNLYGTGVLLFDGTAVLTAAHLFTVNTMLPTVSIVFETISGIRNISASRVLAHSSYDPAVTYNDLAIVWLSQYAPIAAQRYGLYRAGDEIAQTITIVGYGVPGTGSTGVINQLSGQPIRHKANNQFDTDDALLASHIVGPSIWGAATGEQLIADFDNGLAQNDALGLLTGHNGLGLGTTEGLISKGDSGGPALIRDLVAGIASYTTSRGGDIDTISNSSFGEIAGWQRVSAYQQWIDQSLRAQYANAPTTRSAVQKTVLEGNTGTTPIYFWIQFNGLRTQADQRISVDYKTRDGSAWAGQDYIATQGTLNLYPNEDHALVVVEPPLPGKLTPLHSDLQGA